MILLLLAILSNALIGFIFRFFPNWKVDQFPAIVINYWVCVMIGLIWYGPSLWDWQNISRDVAPYLLFLGSIFILGFNIVAFSVRFFGVTFTTIMQKISLVVTAFYAIVVFDESSSFEKWLGIGCAVIAIIFLQRKKKEPIEMDKTKLPWYYWFVPLAVLAVNAIIDTTFLQLERLNLYASDDLRLVSYIFAIAGILGTLILLYRYVRGEAVLTFRECKAGLLLGMINYFSIHFVLAALTIDWEGGVFYTVLNVGILCVVAIGGVFFFKEKMSLEKWIGFLFVLLSIVLISDIL